MILRTSRNTFMIGGYEKRTKRKRPGFRPA